MVNNVAGVNTNEEADDNGGNVMEHRFHNWFGKIWRLATRNNEACSSIMYFESRWWNSEGLLNIRVVSRNEMMGFVIVNGRINEELNGF